MAQFVLAERPRFMRRHKSIQQRFTGALVLKTLATVIR